MENIKIIIECIHIWTGLYNYYGDSAHIFFDYVDSQDFIMCRGSSDTVQDISGGCLTSQGRQGCIVLV